MLCIYEFHDYPLTQAGEYFDSITHYTYLTYVGFIEQYTSLLWDIEYFTVGSQTLLQRFNGCLHTVQPIRTSSQDTPHILPHICDTANFRHAIFNFRRRKRNVSHPILIRIGDGIFV